RGNFDNNLEGRLRIVPGMHIGLNEINLHASLGGQCTRFTLRRRRKIERNDIQPLLGEPHAVTALSVRDRERPAAPWQQFLTRFEKVIRLLAEFWPWTDIP